MAAHRRLKKPKYLCQPCLDANDYQTRRALRCGYVQESDWCAGQRDHGYIGGAPIRQPETCPGYTTTLPIVSELADAWGWWKRGQLGMMADLPPTVAHLISVFNAEISAAESWYYEEIKPKG